MTTVAPPKAGGDQPPVAAIKPKGDGFIMKIIIVGVLLLVVMAGEFAIVIFFFADSGKNESKPESVAQSAHGTDTAHGAHGADSGHDAHGAKSSHDAHGAKSSSGAHGETETITASGDDLIEVEIERFNCANGMASQGFTIHVSFRLVATVSGNQVSYFHDAVTKEQKYRVQQAVDKVIRSSTHDELSDSNLDRIKRRIREDINKILGNSYIQEVIITEFRMMEQ
jgi:flagellar basal body-associated protein FliL